MANIKKIGNIPRNKICDSYEEVQEKILKPTAKGLASYLADETYRQLYNNTLRLLYNAYNPSSYDRTFEFLNSIVKKKGTIYSGNIYQTIVSFDWEILTLEKRGPNQWGAHVGFSGQDFRKGLVDVLENGTSNGLFPRQGAAFIETTADWISANVDGLAVKVTGKERYVDTGEDTPMDKVLEGIRIRVHK